jgi:hypothetical protein
MKKERVIFIYHRPDEQVPARTAENEESTSSPEYPIL